MKPPQTIKLDLCPFCGGKVRFNHNIWGEPEAIRCDHCHYVLRYSRIKVERGEPFAIAMEKMADAWNRRTVNVEKQCKSCSHWEGTICEYRPWPTGDACADWEARDE